MTQAQQDTSDLGSDRLSLLRSLLSKAVAIGSADPQGPLPAPFPEERACLSANAVDKRRREFAAGRAAAHQAMRALNREPAPILIGPKRAPLWPAGVSGSITHCRSCALAAIARHSTHPGLGIDVEEDTPLSADLWPSIANATERDWLARHPNPGQAGKLLFSAKEAAYKAQYAISQRFFGFDGLDLTFVDGATGAGGFTATFTGEQPPFRAGARLQGRFAIGCGVIITAVEILNNEPCT
ncbi:4'-phosphopantetheinyl transferase superfamily protein [Epibacterium sp. MM17-32]|uniref:4'-phosphopantetheinyl transferase family protein n=1 Tax=Epibacterium sp. MM17-32 TaxID=2917734 RepID=UPI001EF47C85|nr:4'-phosphopantetheinyl transferase superfamily protein [Epibacterium sp. MM17-32]MCG7628925.1 4'-phosphopantetheinyl transferase superfamily protein [Epibacterium sp. MM17-32]